MLVKVNSATHSGLNSIGVEVEINIAERGLPKLEIIGLPAKSVEESKGRVKTAILNSGISFPSKRITINLAPADIPKEGSFYDFPIAVGIISPVLEQEIPKNSLFFGELSLDGSLRHTKGALLFALFAKNAGFENLFLPKSSANEAAIVSGINIYGVRNLKEMVNFLLGKISIDKTIYQETREDKNYFPEFDMKEIIGQEQAKRAVEIAAAGGHNIFMVGSPGSGKTMLARALPGIMPPLKKEEALEVTKIYSATGNIPPGGSLIKRRPFRTPHHSTSLGGLIGGGSRPTPGEITLAHRGVLFLDEFNEFPRSILESMRQPMEDGYLTISRSRERVKYPAQFMLVASSNPCPCGYLYHPTKACTCTPREIENYRKRVSGPIMDRIDIHIKVPVVDVKKLSNKEIKKEESSAEIQARIISAREVQSRRFRDENINTNTEMKNKHIKKYCGLSEKAEEILTSAALKYGLSARSYFRLIKVSRTIADLERADQISAAHIAEALQYRSEID